LIWELGIHGGLGWEPVLTQFVMLAGEIEDQDKKKDANQIFFSTIM